MRALTVRQPWAWAIVSGEKDVENRSWATPHRGRIWIHAAVNPANGTDGKHDTKVMLKALGDRAVYGAIIGSVDLVDVITDSPSDWAMPGNYHWVLRDPIALPAPVACKGALQLWTPGDELGLPGLDQSTLF
jgi:hypothetical protein